MYQIKQVPEDFFVEESSTPEIKERGDYAICLLKKNDTTTMKAVQLIARALGIKDKDIGFAGTKDKKAITIQYISIKGVPKERIATLNFDNFSVEYKGRSEGPINLGRLTGNYFEIVVRNISKAPEIKYRFPNYFGEQRFSKNNGEVGKAIVKKDFSGACKLILENLGDHERDLKVFLDEHPTDFVGALRGIPRKILMIYVHAYQSKLWNKMLTKYVEDNEEDKVIPIIGFGTDSDEEEISEMIEEVLSEEGITERDFIIKQLPEASFEGEEREAYCEVKEGIIGELEDDELNTGMKKVKIKFKLPKGSYATEYIKYLFS